MKNQEKAANQTRGSFHVRSVGLATKQTARNQKKSYQIDRSLQQSNDQDAYSLYIKLVKQLTEEVGENRNHHGEE
jgi:hypothetical protein